MIFSNKVYNNLKFVALVVLPALGAFYFAIAGYWALPYPEQVVGTLAAVDVFLGVLLGISTANYNKQQTSLRAISYSQSSEDALSPTKTITYYDVLKWVAQLLIPALATLYFALANIWNLPYPKEVVGSLTAIDALLGAMVGINNGLYTKPE